MTTPPRDKAPRRTHRIVLMVCDPTCLYAYWDESTGEHLDSAEELSQWVMRLHDVTQITPQDANLQDFLDYQCESGATDGVLGEVIPGRSYRVELGVRGPDEGFLPVAMSNEVQTPPDKTSNWVEDHFVTFRWDQALDGFASPTGLNHPPPEPVHQPGDWGIVIEEHLTPDNAPEPQHGEFEPGVGLREHVTPRTSGVEAIILRDTAAVVPGAPAATTSEIKSPRWQGDETVRRAAGAIPGEPPLDRARASTVTNVDEAMSDQHAAAARWIAIDTSTEPDPPEQTRGLDAKQTRASTETANVDATTRTCARHEDAPRRAVRPLPFRGTAHNGNPSSSLTNPRGPQAEPLGTVVSLSSSATTDEPTATWSDHPPPARDQSPDGDHSAR